MCRTDRSLARARQQRVTSDPCFHFFCILSASGKSTNHSRPPLPVLWWASDQMFRYFGGELDWDARWQRWIPCWLQLMPLCQLAAGSDVVSPCQFLLTSTALHSDLKKLFYHTNRWLSALAGLACTSVADAKGAINLVSGWCNTSTCIMYYIFNVMPLREAQLKKLHSLFGHCPNSNPPLPPKNNNNHNDKGSDKPMLIWTWTILAPNHPGERLERLEQCPNRLFQWCFRNIIKESDPTSFI